MQGDVLCAEALHQILVTREGQSRLLAAFIHRVVPLYQTVSTLRTPRSNKTSWLATWRDRNIFLHRTHVGMAVQVCNGLIPPLVPPPPPPPPRTNICVPLAVALHMLAWQCTFVPTQCPAPKALPCPSQHIHTPCTCSALLFVIAGAPHWFLRHLAQCFLVS